MLQKVFNYVKEHPLCTTNHVAVALGLQGLEALAAADELHARGFLRTTVIPLSETNDSSIRYSAIKDSFIDNSEFCICKKQHPITTGLDPDGVGYWDTCSVCGKHLEDGFQYYSEFEGMDFDDADL